ncbi:aspartyl/asparaginyl beta-hydroxylase domain-containing protein [Streptomyces sp. NPDC056503]|uniref:aspartyl/asparaginyl beta-hydroxylase domain-containing protein n=1 Tax=Streptomyces sp. NPDC056503 TaxID=3345842 RepID=UPI0036C20DBF
MALGSAGSVERLRAELDELRRAGAPLAPAAGQRVLRLHTPGGNQGYTGPDGPGLVGSTATPWLDRLPVLAGVLRALPAPVRSARLVALSPGVSFTGLQSPKNGPPWGLCRLHLPLVSGPGARTVFVEDNHHWEPGVLWFSASWRQHALVNDRKEELVHAVIDLYHSAELADLFPRELHWGLRGPAALEHRPVVPFGVTGPERFACRFPLPESFANWEQPGIFLPRNALRGVVTAEIALRGDALCLLLDGRPFCALDHLGEGEFRMRGWSEERTLQVSLAADAPNVVVARAREGSNTYMARLPAVASG